MTDYNFGKQNFVKPVVEQKDRVYFLIPYDQKDKAKTLGYKWDMDKKCWYKDISFTRNLVLCYGIHKNHNEPHIYDKYNDLFSVKEKEPILDEECINKTVQTRSMLYSA